MTHPDVVTPGDKCQEGAPIWNPARGHYKYRRKPVLAQMAPKFIPFIRRKHSESARARGVAAALSPDSWAKKNNRFLMIGRRRLPKTCSNVEATSSTR
jgi:hypothetical protein